MKKSVLYNKYFYIYPQDTEKTVFTSRYMLMSFKKFKKQCGPNATLVKTKSKLFKIPKAVKWVNLL